VVNDALDDAMRRLRKCIVILEPPKHPLPAMTTFELRDYRRQLESAITFFAKQDPAPPARDELQAKLDVVLAEQESRTRLANAR
jgi:hypothetical protein